MELKYIVLTIIKILISVPTILLLQSMCVNGAALMGGHIDNKTNNSTKNTTNPYLDDYELYDSQEISHENNTTPDVAKLKEGNVSENIPDPSPLVLPGYNLPENIFNKGKPFYLERDPLTGQIDFNSKSSTLKLDEDLYDYVDDEPSGDVYDKTNIDRKDGSIGSHRPSDVNQLTPNFHDFLNLPVKYNSDKYVYPLISSSYANTKVQGNVNKYHNHKDYNIKTSTVKPTGSPTYYSENYSKDQYYGQTKLVEYSTTQPTTTTKKTTTPKVENIELTTRTNLLQSPMNHPSFNEEFNEEYYGSPQKPDPNEIYLTTENVNKIYLTTKPTTKLTTTTTKRTMSLFEQLFGDYDETVATTEKTKPPPLFVNLPNNKNKNKYDSEVKTEKPSYTTPIYTHYPNSHAGPSSMAPTIPESYEYEDEYPENPEDNIATENKQPSINQISTNKINTTTVAPTTTETPKIVTTGNNKNTNSIGTQTSEIDFENETDYEEENYDKVTSTTKTTTTATTTTSRPTTEAATTPKVTSLPLGENHVTSLNNQQPIIVATQNIREQLLKEKVVPKPFGFDKPILQNAPSTSNIHIAPDQDTVSFVVGHHQSVDGGQYVGTSLKESPYESNPFRPLYGSQNQYTKDTSVSYKVQANPEVYSPEIYQPTVKFPEVSGSSVTIQPLKNSEASLSIGVPINSVKQVPGQVVDEKLELDEEKIEYPKGNGPKVVFPDNDEVENLVPPSLSPPPVPKPETSQKPPPSRDVLNLNSNPMYHQLPSDLTPPKEQDLVPPPRLDRPRPPWDPRPGHFYSGKPEYARPPRPDIAYKRIDNLPNILPQFRPGAANINNNNIPKQHYYDNRLNRQPLLERPSNRPIGFFEKLQPPPPPKNLHHIRKIPPPQSLRPEQTIVAEDRIINEAPAKPIVDQFAFYKTPPKVMIANRRNGNDESEVETLQMIQAKKGDKKEAVPITISTPEQKQENPDKSLYVVYPVNTGPLKLDVLDSNKKESVVIGTRAELPLPPSKINQDFSYEQNPILNPKDRNDSPVLKPHPRPPTFPIKSDFPYPLERPDPSILNPAVPETPSNNGNNLEEPVNKFDEEGPGFVSSNQWNTIGENVNVESRIVSSKINTQTNQISATLKTYTEKPIAVAYTPTEPHNKHNIFTDKYSMPNYASPVIPEIRRGTVENAETGHGSTNNDEFTVSAVMHTHPQLNLVKKDEVYKHKGTISDEKIVVTNHKSDTEGVGGLIPTQQDFQAPFQASVNVDSSMSQGWSVVSKSTTESAEVTTIPIATTSEFDIENFKPQLEGGFKPIYNFPDDAKSNDSEVSERQEK